LEIIHHVFSTKRELLRTLRGAPSTPDAAAIEAEQRRWLAAI
jgi:hypothetical protein